MARGNENPHTSGKIDKILRHLKERLNKNLYDIEHAGQSEKDIDIDEVGQLAIENQAIRAEMAAVETMNDEERYLYEHDSDHREP